MLYVVSVKHCDFLCSGSYIHQGERYQVVGKYSEARKFKTYDSAKRWVEKLIETRANVSCDYSIVNSMERCEINK